MKILTLLILTTLMQVAHAANYKTPGRKPAGTGEFQCDVIDNSPEALEIILRSQCDTSKAFSIVPYTRVGVVNMCCVHK